MKILATKSVTEGSQINVLQKENGTWILISEKEFKNEIKSNEDNIFALDEAYLYSRIPKLNGKLDQKVMLLLSPRTLDRTISFNGN